MGRQRQVSVSQSGVDDEQLTGSLPAARRTATRLVSELRAALGRLPADRRTAAGLSDLLGLEKTSCHRIVATLEHASDPDGHALVALPGPRALRQFVSALRGSGSGDVEFDGLSAAIEVFAAFLKEAGGSQAALQRRLAMAGPDVGPDAAVAPTAETERLARMYRDAAEFSGSDAHADISVRILRRMPADLARAEELLCRGFVGYGARADARPLAVWSTVAARSLADGTAAPHEASDVAGETAVGQTLNCIVQPFSSHPLPIVLGDQVGFTEGLLHIVDPAALAGGRRVNVMILNRHVGQASDASEQPGRACAGLADKDFWYLSNYPARHMLVDIYVERPFFRAPNVPTVGCHTWDPSFETGKSPRWLSELPTRPTLQLIPPELDRAGHECYPRLAELTAHIFRTAGADRSGFNGYRLYIPYPVWRTCYRIGFEFMPTTSAEPGRPVNR